MNPAKIAAKPPDTISYWGQREYFSLVYIFSLRKKLISKVDVVKDDKIGVTVAVGSREV